MMYRNKWKDAVDLFFLSRQGHIPFREAIQVAKNIYGGLYREECTYETILRHSWDTTEVVEYIGTHPPSDEEIENFLVSAVEDILLSPS